MGVVKQHVFKFLYTGLNLKPELRRTIGEAKEFETLVQVANEIKEF